MDLSSELIFTSPTLDVQSFPRKGPDITGDVVGTSDTSGLISLIIPQDTKISDLRLQSLLVVQIRQTQEGVLAETWLEGVYEYGAGQDASAAVTDLIVSLGEYLGVLENRQGKLGDSAKHEFDALRRLIKRDI